MAIAADTPIGERRSARRVPVRRRAVLVCAEGAVPHVTGTAVDMSCDGMGIRAHQPLPCGQVVDIELEPQVGKPETEEILVRGRIARVLAISPHDCLLGVSFTKSGWPTVSIPARGHLKLVEVPVPREMAPGPSKPKPKRRLSRAISGILLLLLLSLLGLLWPGETPTVRAARSSGAQESFPPPELIPPERDTEDSVSALGEVGALPKLVELSPWPGLPHAPHALVRGDYVLAARRGSQGEAGPPVSTAQNGAGHAGRPVPLGEAFEGGEPGSGRGEDMPGTSESISARGVAPEDSEGAVGGPSGARDEAGAGVLVEVDRRAFRMRVYTEGRLAAEYPVGVGHDDSTPLGEFTIANKIAKPAWYHRGETVPYGDPRNPLGESWMGFACDGVPMSYGIHPTNEPASIGAATGAGCVRMRPEDAASLFRLCPRGAAVRICDGPAVGQVAGAASL
ncbi:MAG: L,D-transpeptidase [Candidatus Hydrogenedentes bacterium]|nr:L,D-transpeptidase [Candidatus Hydrogenedentota bacterium]